MLILASPVLITYGAIMSLVAYRRKIKDANAFHCPDCGNIVGKEGLRLADKEWPERKAALQDKHPRIKFGHATEPHIVRWLHAICPVCGKRFSYLNMTRRFKPELKAAHEKTPADEAGV